MSGHGPTGGIGVISILTLIHPNISMAERRQRTDANIDAWTGGEKNWP
jgi:hypothetical protein